MTSAAWSWLPDAALLTPAVLKPIDEALEAWSHRWFRRRVFVRRRTAYGATGGPPAVASTGRVAVRLDPGAAEALTGQALDLDLARLEHMEDDRRVIDGVRQALLEDLARIVDASLAGDATALEPAADSSGAVVIEVGDEDGRKIAVVETSRAVLASARLARLAPSARPRPKFTSLRQAVAEVPVSLGVRLGSAEIRLPEARQLAIGDVVVLDRRLKDALEILSSPRGAVVACARLMDAASPRSLRLEPPQEDRP